jgi:hypothetical protein
MPTPQVETVDPYGNPDDSPERVQEKIEMNDRAIAQNIFNEQRQGKIDAIRVQNFAGQTKEGFMLALVGNNMHQLQRNEADLIYEVTVDMAQTAQRVANASRDQIDAAEQVKLDAVTRAEVGEGKFAKSLMIRAELEQHIIDNGWHLPDGRTAADFPDGIPGGSGAGNKGEPPIDDVTPGQGQGEGNGPA